MPIHVVLISFIAFIVIVQIILRSSKSGFEENCAEYLEKSAEADNNIVKGDISLPYVSPDISALPFTEYPDTPEFKKLIRKQKTALSKSKLTMIKLPENLSNIDLKMKYGANNFETVTLYEEHFNGYHRALYEWASELIASGNKDDAVSVLSHAIAFDSNISGAYKALADLYFEKHDTASLKKLLASSESSDIIQKDALSKYIQGKL